MSTLNLIFLFHTYFSFPRNYFELPLFRMKEENLMTDNGAFIISIFLCEKCRTENEKKY